MILREILYGLVSTSGGTLLIFWCSRCFGAYSMQLHAQVIPLVAKYGDC